MDRWQKASILASILSTVVVGGMAVVLQHSSAITTAALAQQQLNFSMSQAESTRNVQEGAVVSTLLKQLFELGGKHRSPILTVLESHMNPGRYAALCAAIAQDDSDEGLRLTAIRRLGSTSSASGATVLSTISRDKSRTADERQLAEQNHALIVEHQLQQPSNATAVAPDAHNSPYSKLKTSMGQLGSFMYGNQQSGTVMEMTQNNIDRCCRFGEPPLTPEQLAATWTTAFQTLYDFQKEDNDHYIEWVKKFGPVRQEIQHCLPLTANQVTADNERFRAADADARVVWDLNRVEKEHFDPKRFTALISYVKDLAKNAGDSQACGR